jgi:hypothetical protein
MITAAEIRERQRPVNQKIREIEKKIVSLENQGTTTCVKYPLGQVDYSIDLRGMVQRGEIPTDEMFRKAFAPEQTEELALILRGAGYTTDFEFGMYGVDEKGRGEGVYCFLVVSW